MGEIDHEKDAVDKGVAQGNQGINSSNGQAVYDLIDNDLRVEEIGHDTARYCLSNSFLPFLMPVQSEEFDFMTDDGQLTLVRTPIA